MEGCPAYAAAAPSLLSMRCLDIDIDMAKRDIKIPASSTAGWSTARGKNWESVPFVSPGSRLVAASLGQARPRRPRRGPRGLSVPSDLVQSLFANGS